jgi:hypothetical protein
MNAQQIESVFTAADVRRLRKLSDRQEILDCIHRYCRAIDRFDRELLISVYHPDAIDDHGLFVGGPKEFADWAIGLFSGLNKEGPSSVHFGRYIDRFERRNGKWAIAARACLIEWHGMLGELQMPPEATAAYDAVGPSVRDRTDMSYRRPLMVRKSAG